MENTGSTQLSNQQTITNTPTAQTNISDSTSALPMPTINIDSVPEPKGIGSDTKMLSGGITNNNQSNSKKKLIIGLVVVALGVSIFGYIWWKRSRKNNIITNITEEQAERIGNIVFDMEERMMNKKYNTEEEAQIGYSRDIAEIEKMQMLLRKANYRYLGGGKVEKILSF